MGLNRTQGGGEVSQVIDVLIFDGIGEVKRDEMGKVITESTPDAGTECLDHLRAALFGVFDKLRF